jgi:hypothetical protein
MGVKFNSGSAPATPSAGKVEVYTDSSDKRLKSIDETPTTRVFVDRDSAETLTNKTITTSPSLLSTGTGGVGYATGAGGTITQSTNKSTGVTLSTICGAITMNNAALAAATIVSFVLTNTTIAVTDVMVLNHISGGTIGAYTLNAQCAAGSATINVRNNTAGSLSDAIIIQFAVIKGVNA